MTRSTTPAATRNGQISSVPLGGAPGGLSGGCRNGPAPGAMREIDGFWSCTTNLLGRCPDGSCWRTLYTPGWSVAVKGGNAELPGAGVSRVVCPSGLVTSTHLAPGSA